MAGKPKEKMVSIPARIYEDLMRDWVRLRKFENHVLKVTQGVDYEATIESLQKSVAEWTKIAIDAQMPKAMKARARKRESQRQGTGGEGSNG